MARWVYSVGPLRSRTNLKNARRSVPMSDDGLALKAISVLKDFISKGQGGLNYTSDQITYPNDLGQVPGDVYSKTRQVTFIHKTGSLYASDEITFVMHGEFRAYDQPIENDPNSIVMPVMANVYVDLDS